MEKRKYENQKKLLDQAVLKIPVNWSADVMTDETKAPRPVPEYDPVPKHEPGAILGWCIVMVIALCILFSVVGCSSAARADRNYLVTSTWIQPCELKFAECDHGGN